MRLCLDEFYKQLVGEVRDPLPAHPGTAARYDSEYVRHGSTSAFVIYAPLEGHREVYLGPDGRRTTHDAGLCPGFGVYRDEDVSEGQKDCAC